VLGDTVLGELTQRKPTSLAALADILRAFETQVGAGKATDAGMYDPPAYRALCHWVDRIQEERRCDAGDPEAARRGGAPLDDVVLRAREAPGCYVRGSRIIVLRRPPEGGGGPALVRQRAEALKRLAGYSQAFWIDRVR